MQPGQIDNGTCSHVHAHERNVTSTCEVTNGADFSWTTPVSTLSTSRFLFFILLSTFEWCGCIFVTQPNSLVYCFLGFFAYLQYVDYVRKFCIVFMLLHPLPDALFINLCN